MPCQTKRGPSFGLFELFDSLYKVESSLAILDVGSTALKWTGVAWNR